MDKYRLIPEHNYWKVEAINGLFSEVKLYTGVEGVKQQGLRVQTFRS
jgi:hypothetical protein